MKPDPRPLALAVLGRGVVDPDVPVIHADDPGLLRGLAAFETLRVYGGRPFALTEHLARLGLSALRMGLEMPDARALEELAAEAIEAAGVPDCSMRFVLTGGSPGHGPVAMVFIGALPAELEATRSAGIRVISLQLGTDPRARQHAPWLLDGVKSTSYAVNMAARDEALRRGADDAVFVASDGTVLEGSDDQRLVATRPAAVHALARPGHPGRRDPRLDHAPGRDRRLRHRGGLVSVVRHGRGRRGLHLLVGA